MEKKLKIKKKFKTPKVVSLKWKLLSMFLCVSISITLAISIIVFNNSKKIISEQSNKEMLINTERGVEIISALIQGEQIQIEALAESKEVIDAVNESYHKGFDAFKKEHSNVTETLVKRLKNTKLHENFFVANKDGNVILGSTKEILAVTVEDREYFQSALKGESNISDSMLSKISDKPIIVIAVPVKDFEDNIIGVAGVSMLIEYFGQNLKNVKVGDTGYAYMFDNKGISIYHPKDDIQGKHVKNLGIDVIDDIVNNLEETNYKSDVRDYVYNGLDKVLGYSVVPETKWIIFAGTEKKEFYDPIESLLNRILIVALMIIGCTIIISLIFSNKIVKDITLIKNGLIKASEGDLTAQLEIKSNDEISHIASSFNIMLNKTNSALANIRNYAKKILDSSKVLKDTSTDISASINEVALAVQGIAEGSNDQAKKTYDISNDMIEFSNSIQNAVDNVEEVFKQSENISTLNIKGKKVINDLSIKNKESKQALLKVRSTITELVIKVDTISSILTAISSIAQQTNLLSLNASIEAARAGEYGKGFSVVADEIRKLAEQSTNSADEIELIVKDIQSRTIEADKLMNSTMTISEIQNEAIDKSINTFENININIDNISTNVLHVTKLLSSINVKKDSIASAIHDISLISESAASSSEEVSAGTEEQSANTEQMNELAIGLEKIVEELNNVIGNFEITE